MKKIFLAAISIVCLMASCSKDETLTPQNNPMAGKEVVFSPNQDFGTDTRTIYGPQFDSISKKFHRIYWVNDDKVKIYGSGCAVPEAEYAVSVTKDQNYADALNKTGAAGVQWGSNATADFLAIYPSSAVKEIKSSTEATLTIRSTQNNVFAAQVDDGGQTTWVGHPILNDATTKTLADGIMYARTAGATPTDENGNPQVVDLRFKPYSTVLRFKFTGVDSQNSDITVYVQSITVTSPDGSPIAGDFNLAVSGTGANATATATVGTTTSNTITLHTIQQGGSYIPLQENVPIEFDVFTLPLSGQTISAAWTVEVATNYGTYTYKLTPTSTSQNTTLAAGKIHHITIPLLEVLGTANWDPSNWMTNIPTPVYLSELSVPGAWYCMDSNYQNSTEIATLYNAGIRAFNIDCRISKKNCNDDANFSWLGAEKAWTDADYTDGKGYLACAGTEPAPSIGYSDTQILSDEGIYVSEIVSNIIAVAKQNPKEYVVIVFTYAEKPFSNSGALFGSVRPDYITAELNTILNTEGIKEYLYTNITKDTTIEDVLNSGKNVIVKINHSNVDFATSTSPSFSMPEGHMASFGSMATEGYIQGGITDIISGLTTEGNAYYGYYAKMQSYPIYNGKTASGLTYYYHQAQKTSSDETQGNTSYTAVPTLGQRKDAIDNIIAKSTEIYDASTHDAWFQIAIGGSIDGDDPAGVAPLGTHLQTKIEAKMENDPSPIGIVLMNHACNADGSTIDIVLDIINMNSKFYLKRKGNDITTDGTTDSSGSGTEGGGDESSSGSDDSNLGEDQQ